MQIRCFAAIFSSCRRGAGGTAGRSARDEHRGSWVKGSVQLCLPHQPRGKITWCKWLDGGFDCPEALRCKSREYKLLWLTTD